MFAATAATIVSGAIAGRTKFETYAIFTLVMTAIIYPISGGWQWQGSGWLTELGFIDFAGSSISSRCRWLCCPCWSLHGWTKNWKIC